MSLEERAGSAVEMIATQLSELSGIVETAKADRDFTLARQRIERWKSRTVMLVSGQISASEGAKLEQQRTTSVPLDRMRSLVGEASLYRGFLLPLKDQLEAHPEEVLTDTVTVGPERAPQAESRTVFIVHGHDEANTLRLEKLLNTQWGLPSLVLRDKPGAGRTLIEKFEEEASQAGFAFALITSDDLVEVPHSQERYSQARPNVIFELGWFYGRLGRDKVCILFKKGTKIPTDLDGINRIEFADSVNEKILEMARELKAALLVGE